MYETRRRRRQKFIVSAPSAPTVIAAPVILGTPTDGTPTSYVTGTYGGSPTPSVTRQWRLNGVDIGGATGPTYTPVPGDVGGTLTVRETATNASGSVQSTSAGVVVVSSGASSSHINTRAGDTLATRAADQLAYR